MAKKKIVPRIGTYIPESAESTSFWYAELWHLCLDCMTVSYEKIDAQNNDSIVGTISSRCTCGGLTEIIHQRVAQVYF